MQLNFFIMDKKMVEYHLVKFIYCSGLNSTYILTLKKFEFISLFTTSMIFFLPKVIIML